MDSQGPPPPPPPPPPPHDTHQNLLQSFPFTSEPTRDTYHPWVAANAPTRRELRVQTASLAHHLSEQHVNFEAEVDSQGRAPNAVDRRHARNLANLRLLWGTDTWWPAARPPTLLPPNAKLCAAMVSLTKEFQKRAPGQPLWDLWSDAPTGFLAAAIRAVPDSRGRLHGDVVYAALRGLKAHFGLPAVVPPPRRPRARAPLPTPTPAPSSLPSPAPAPASAASRPDSVRAQAQGRQEAQGEEGEGEGEEEEKPELPRSGFGEDWDMNLSLGAPLDDTLPPRPTEDPLTDLKLPPPPTPSPPPPCYDSDSCSEVSVSGVIADYLARPGVPAAPTTAKHRRRRLEALEAKFREQVAADKKKTKEEAKKRAREAKAAKPRIRPTKKAKMARDLANVMVDAFSERLETEFAGDLSAQRLEAAKRSLRALNVKKIKELL